MHTRQVSICLLRNAVGLSLFIIVQPTGAYRPRTLYWDGGTMAADTALQDHLIELRIQLV